MTCQFKQTCPSRMAEGDTENGCNKVDELFDCAIAKRISKKYKMIHIERAWKNSFFNKISQTKKTI